MNAPASARKLLKLAENALDKGRGGEVIRYCNEVLKSYPGHPKAHHMLGVVYYAAGQYRHAEEMLQKAVAGDEKHIPSYILLAKLAGMTGNGTLAMKIMNNATAQVPESMEAHAAMAGMLLQFNNSHLVPAYIEQVRKIGRLNNELLQYYAIALKIEGRTEEADAVYRDLLKRNVAPPSYQVMYECYLPRTMYSQEQIDTLRDTYAASLEKFIRSKPAIPSSQLSYNSNFYLAFHNRDNKELLSNYTRMVRACVANAQYTAPHCNTPLDWDGSRPLRIGFISRNMHDHSVGRCYRRVLRALHRQPHFQVTLFTIENHIDHTIRELEAEGVKIQQLSANLTTAQKTIGDYELDIAIYPDIGMDMATHYLAMARLAHYQCCLLGHPDTTGIDTIDYYISYRDYELPHAQEHYSEQLLLCPGMNTLYARPAPPPHWPSRADLGLPEDRTLYACPMAIQKMHPDFDDVLKAILEKDPKAVLVLFNDYQQKSASDQLKERILKKCPEDRVAFIDWLPLDALWGVLNVCDALLTTIYFGAGTTARYAFAYGMPMVTMSGDYVRSRIVEAFYKRMGVQDAPVVTNTEDYVEVAVKLANDKAYHEHLSRQIRENSHKLFDEYEEQEKIDDYVRLFEDMARQRLDAYRP